MQTIRLHLSQCAIEPGNINPKNDSLQTGSDYKVSIVIANLCQYRTTTPHQEISYVNFRATISGEAVIRLWWPTVQRQVLIAYRAIRLRWS